MHKVQEFTYDWPDAGVVLFYSDGIVTHWSLDAHPALLEYDPAVIAGALYRDFTRKRDDATVLVARRSGA